MDTYRHLWASWWLVVLGTAMLAGALHLGIVAVLIIFTFPASVVLCAGVSVDSANPVATWGERVRASTGVAAWTGASVAAMSSIAHWNTAAGLLLAAAVPASSPWLVTKLGARLGKISGGQSRSRKVRRLSLADLNHAWIRSEHDLLRATTVDEKVALAATRQVLLEEMERRQWLTFDDFDLLWSRRPGEP